MRQLCLMLLDTSKCRSLNNLQIYYLLICEIIRHYTFFPSVFHFHTFFLPVSPVPYPPQISLNIQMSGLSCSVVFILPVQKGESK
jgi:hypothetical protein